MTSSWRLRFLIFCHAPVRRPDSYFESSFFAITPSSPALALASFIVWPPPFSYGGVCHEAPASFSWPSALRRSEYTCSISEWPSCHSRSNVMYVTGTSFILRRISDSDVRPMRCWISSKLGRPLSSRATIPPSTKAIARMPSHLNSKPQASSGVGSLGASLASIGSTFCGMGLRSGSCGGSMRWIIQSFPVVWKRTYRPFSRLPWRTTMTSRSDHLIGSYVPSSQISTCPPPYSPLGISPANLKYSSGWSSTCTARWFCFGSGGMPLGTAHETPTPSFSSRKSQCSRRAWCSWTTNRGARAACLGTRAPGSGVFLKSRLASYSASFFAITSKVRLRLLLPEPDLEADPLGRDLACPEWAGGGELLKPVR